VGVIEGRTWTELISEEHCWELLDGAVVGRLGVVVDGAPEIFPVNYATDQRSIVFRTGSGNKLVGLTQSARVAFEVDEIDADRRLGWSVLVKGRAAVTTEQPADAHPDLWIPAERPVWIRITPSEVTGRRIWSRSQPDRD
jgi:nitroimidazol reductase NimA-like FMN-containing flavoprotein (pyridoxamine 5'-phosphate oxidase superfamily)